MALQLAACGVGDPGTTADPPAAVQPVRCVSAPPVALRTAGASDWPVYHRTPDRHGVDGAATAGGRLAPLWAVWLDGLVFAEPLAVAGIVVAATQHDTVYGLDAATGCVRWQTSLGASFLACGGGLPCGDPRQHRLSCGNIPEIGVTATPAVDPLTGTVYVVAYLDPGRFEMDALDLLNGAVRWRHPIELPGSDPLYQLSRPALAIANGRAYASFGGRAGDCGNFHGFVVGVRLDGAGPDVRYQVSPNREGAIWAPGGPVVLPGGDLLTATGNTDASAVFDGANSVVRLSPSLERLDFFAPSNWAKLNELDYDTGSVGPTLLDAGRVFQVGKDGVGYLLDAGSLGGVGGERFAQAMAGRRSCYAIGATAYLAPMVYVPCDHGLTALRVDASRFAFAWQGPDFRSGSPIVAGGLVWDVDFEGGCLWGLDVATGAVRQRVAIGGADPAWHFLSLSSAGGRLFVPAGRRLLAFRFG